MLWKKGRIRQNNHPRGVEQASPFHPRKENPFNGFTKTARDPHRRAKVPSEKFITLQFMSMNKSAAKCAVDINSSRHLCDILVCSSTRTFYTIHQESKYLLNAKFHSMIQVIEQFREYLTKVITKDSSKPTFFTWSLGTSDGRLDSKLVRQCQISCRTRMLSSKIWWSGANMSVSTVHQYYHSWKRHMERPSEQFQRSREKCSMYCLYCDQEHTTPCLRGWPAGVDPNSPLDVWDRDW